MWETALLEGFGATWDLKKEKKKKAFGSNYFIIEKVFPSGRGWQPSAEIRRHHNYYYN